MSITVLVVISILLVLGLLYIIHSVRVAEVEDGLLDEELDGKVFSKPPGWKVGTMPKELQNTKKIELVKGTSGKPAYGVENIISKWKMEELSNLNKPE